MFVRALPGSSSGIATITASDRMAHIAIIAGLTSSVVNFRGPLIEALLQQGHRISVLSPEHDAKTVEWLNARGIEHFPIALARSGQSVSGDLKTFFSIRRQLKALRPDHVFSYTIKPVIYGTLAAASAGVPTRSAMITGLGYTFIDGEGGARRKLVQFVARSLYRVALRFAHRIVFQNPDDREVFAQQGLLPASVPVAVVNGSGVDLEKFRPAALPEDVRFLLIARLLKEKGIREYLEAAQLLKTRYPEWEFVLAGPPEDGPSGISVTQVEAAQADGAVIYLGAVDDVRPSLKDCSVYVLPSYREGTPRTVLEAMALGRPIVATDVPGCRETVRDGENGLLVEARNSEDLAIAMERLGLDAHLREQMADVSLAYVRERYDAKKVAAETIEALGL